MELLTERCMLYSRTTNSSSVANLPRQNLQVQYWPRLAGQVSLAILTVSLTTYSVRLLTSLTAAAEPHVYVRPYLGLFVITILLMTWIGGRSLGFFTLILSSLTSLYFLLPPLGWGVSHPSDWVGIGLLISSATVMILGFVAMLQKAVLQARAADTWQANTRQLQATFDAKARLQSVVEAANRHEHEATLKQLLLPVLSEQIAGLDLKVHYAVQLESKNGSTAFFDVFSVRGDLTALLVGTVVGEGLPAATMIAMTRILLRSILVKCGTLTEAVTELNAILVAHHLIPGPNHWYIGLYRPAEHTLTSICCGEVPALIRRAATGLVEPCVETGPLIGLTKLSEYREHCLQLYTGDLIVLSGGGGAALARALASPSSATDAREWIAHLLRNDQDNFPEGLSENSCLLAARILDEKFDGSIGEA